MTNWTPFVRFTPRVADAHGYRNNRYSVLLRTLKVEPFGIGAHLSIRRLDRAPLHDWRDLQRIKNELLGPEVEAVEMYPAESRLVDQANQYHLFGFADYRFPFGFSTRKVSGPDVAARMGATQRPFTEATIPEADA